MYIMAQAPAPGVAKIDHERRPHYIENMNKNDTQQAADQALNGLELRIDELIRTVERLKEENRTLRVQRENLTAERAHLIERNDMARGRVEAMINRLKALEQSA
jgi:cell division protein ZapB